MHITKPYVDLTILTQNRFYSKTTQGDWLNAQVHDSNTFNALAQVKLLLCASASLTNWRGCFALTTQ